MSNALAIVADKFSPEEIEVVKNTCAKGATDEELAMFLSIAHQYKLNPFVKEIYFLKLGGTPTIFASRDGYLSIAHRSGVFDGMISDVVYEGDVFRRIGTEVEHEYGAKRGKIIGSYTVVYRSDKKIPFYAWAPFADYFKNNDVWKKYPHSMTLKISEALALKRAFSISGLVTREELDGPEPPEPKIQNVKVDVAIDAEIVEPEQPVTPRKAMKTIVNPPLPEEREKTPSKAPEQDKRITLWKRYLKVYGGTNEAKEQMALAVGGKASKDWDDEDIALVEQAIEDAEKGASKDAGPVIEKPKKSVKETKTQMDADEMVKLHTRVEELFYDLVGLTEAEMTDWLKKNFGIETIEEMTKNDCKDAVKMGQAVLAARDKRATAKDLTGGLD